MELIVNDTGLFLNSTPSSRGQSKGNSDSDSDAGIMSDAFMEYINVIFGFGINTVASVWALTSSVINIITFSAMDLKNGVNQNFLLLSISDGVYAAVVLAYQVHQLLLRFDFEFKESGISPKTLNILIPAISNLPLSASILITTVIAVVRCCCVVMPLKVSAVLSAKRQLVMILTLLAAVTACYAYSYQHFRLVKGKSKRSNVSRIFLETRGGREIMDVIRNVIFYTCFGIIFVNMIVLIVYLKKASRFRGQAASEPKSDDAKDQSKSSVNREAQVIKCVTLILVVFTFCNLPSILVSLLRLTIPEFTSSGKLKNEKEFVSTISSACLQINVGCNIFVYYFFNSSYKKIFRQYYVSYKCFQ